MFYNKWLAGFFLLGIFLFAKAGDPESRSRPFSSASYFVWNGECAPKVPRMSIVLGLKGRDHAVIVADTLEIRGHNDGMYQERTHKLQKINGTWGIGVAGSLDGLQIVRDFGEEPIEGFSDIPMVAVDQLARHMLDAYRRKGFSQETHFLLAGIEPWKNGHPFLWTWSFKKESEEVKIEGPREMPSGNAIGACNHGALYFAKEFQSGDMSLEQNVIIGFHCVAEVAKHDVRVDRPIDVLVVATSGVTIYPESQLLEFVSRSEKITAAISGCLSAEGLRMPKVD